MAALPLNTLIDAAATRLTAQCAGIVSPNVVFAKSAPVKLDDMKETDAYVLHLYPEDVLRAGNLFRRTHYIQVRLWVRTPDDAGEVRFLALCDAVDNAFYGYQALGQMTVHSATIEAQNAPAYIRVGNVERRQRVWSLEVVEDYQQTMNY